MNRTLRALAVKTQKGVKKTDITEFEKYYKMWSRGIGDPKEKETYSYIHRIDIKSIVNTMKENNGEVRGLDIGCGRGYAILDLSEIGADAWGTSKHLYNRTPVKIKERIIVGSLDNGVPAYYKKFPKNYFDIILSTHGDITYALEYKNVNFLRSLSEIGKTTSERIDENKKWFNDVLRWIDSVSKDDAFISLHARLLPQTYNNDPEVFDILDKNGFKFHSKTKNHQNHLFDVIARNREIYI